MMSLRLQTTLSHRLREFPGCLRPFGQDVLQGNLRFDGSPDPVRQEAEFTPPAGGDPDVR